MLGMLSAWSELNVLLSSSSKLVRFRVLKMMDAEFEQLSGKLERSLRLIAEKDMDSASVCDESNRSGERILMTIFPSA